MNKGKRLFSWVLAMVLLMSLLPVSAAAANTPVSYLSPVMNSGVPAGFEEKSCSNYTEVSAVTPSWTWYSNNVEMRVYNWGISGQDTWYVVSGDTSILGGVVVNGNVHLILKDGCTLATTGADGHAGIFVHSGSSLTIYGQKSGTGEVNATGGDNGAGIGSDGEKNYGDIVINGGTVTANGNGGGAGIGSGKFISRSDQNNGTIVINGGTVTANGNGGGAGIGGGYCIQGCNIEINGGNVKATSAGLFSGAGIGGGFGGDGHNLVILGGNVTAFSEGGGAGIGGGLCGDGTDITINGGTVTARGSSVGAGIGGGYTGTAKNIFIWGGTITATAARPASAIGSGEDSETPASNIEIDTSMTIRNEKTSAIVPNETKDLSTVLKGIPKLSVTQEQMESVNYQFPIITGTRLTGFENKLCESYYAFRKDGSVSSKRNPSSNSALWGFDGQDTWYVASGDITITGGVTVYGNVHLILADGCTLTVTGGGGSAGINVPIGRSLSIYGQSGGTGALIATGGANGAGIGGSIGNGHGKVTVNGGCVTATGGYGAAGIGGSYSDGGNLDVNGGTVIATGCGGGAGIGGGCFGEGHNVVIQGGSVTAIGDGGGAGIGGGAGKEDESSVNDGRNIVIHGGTVTANGNGGGAGIGGGVNGGDGYEIDICGGEVTANGSGNNGSAGIGGGSYGHGHSLNISGGTVVANGSDGGAGIGGGLYGHGYSLDISGGTVVANGGHDAAGIGGGDSGNGADIGISGGTVTATGNVSGAGIGGGCFGTGSNIIIQGGNITANGGSTSKTAIGNGQSADDDASNIKISTALQILSILPNKNPYVKDEVKTTVIANDGEDLASMLAGVMNLSITPLHESIPVTRAVGADSSALVEPITEPKPAGAAVKLRFHGVEGAVNEVEFTSGAALEETHLELPDPAFVGWFYDVKFESQAQVGDIISGDTVLYLKETEDQTEYAYAEVPDQAASVFSSGSPVVLIGGCGLLVLAVGAAVVVSKKKTT